MTDAIDLPPRTAAAFVSLALVRARDGGERIARADRAVIAVLPSRRNPRGAAAARAVSAIAERSPALSSRRQP